MIYNGWIPVTKVCLLALILALAVTIAMAFVDDPAPAII